MVTVNIEKTQLIFLLISILIIMGISLVVAAVPDPGHSYTQIELPAGAWPGLKVNWGEIQNMPAGFADGVDNAGPNLCICIRHLCRDIFTDSEVWRPENCATLDSWTSDNPCGSSYRPVGAVRVKIKTC